MTKIRKETSRDPDASPMDPEVIQFRAEFEERSPLDQLVREGAQKMLQSAIDAEVHDFLSMHRVDVTSKGSVWLLATATFLLGSF